MNYIEIAYWSGVIVSLLGWTVFAAWLLSGDKKEKISDTLIPVLLTIWFSWLFVFFVLVGAYFEGKKDN